MKGIGASKGIAIGKIIIKKNYIEVEKQKIEDCNKEILNLKSAIDRAILEIEELIRYAESELKDEELQIFQAHIHILKDREFIYPMEQKIKEEKVNAPWAVKEVTDNLINMFSSLADEYLRERSNDIVDVSNRILSLLLNVKDIDYKKIQSPFILIAKDLTPSETVKLPKDNLVGFITEEGGYTSHVSILAKILEIPAIVGVKDIISRVKDGMILGMDGDSGEIFINPDEEILSLLENKKKEFESITLRNKGFIGAKSFSSDGKRFNIVCNIGATDHTKDVIKYDGEGIGLLRSEFLYMDRKAAPTEEEQFNIYKQIIMDINTKPVTIRTLDVGGDKKIPYLNIPKEENPFLGYRAIRYCLNEKSILKIQIRAILRASSFGKARIMFPMISTLNELLMAKEILEECKEELKRGNIKYDENIEIGIMIETPAAALISDILAKEVDFFSIGTNDLIQYTIAVDRLNLKVSNLYTPYNPSVLRLINIIIKNGHRQGIEVGMCGEAAGDIKLLPVFMGMGLDEFSVIPSLVLNIRRKISEVSISQCEELVDKVLMLKTSQEIESMLDI